MLEVRTADTLRPGRRAIVRLTLTTGEVVKFVLGADAARHLLEMLLRYPHLRNVAAALLDAPANGAEAAGTLKVLPILATDARRDEPLETAISLAPEARDAGPMDTAMSLLTESRQLLARIRGRLFSRERRPDTP